MDIQKAVTLEPEIRRIIELSEQRGIDQPTTQKEEEFYGQPNRPFTENNPHLTQGSLGGQKNLAEYLRNLSSEELKLVLSLKLTGREIAEEDIEDDNLDRIENVFEKHYASVPEEKNTLIEYIMEEQNNLEKYLTNGLMYSM